MENINGSDSDARVENEWSKIDFENSTKPEVMMPEYGSHLAGVAERVEEMSSDKDAARKFIAFYNKYKDDYSRDHRDTSPEKCNIIKTYCSNHGISDDVVAGFEENVFPMIDAKDPEVTTLLIDNNSWGMTPGDFGISDFVVHSLVSRVNPENTHELMMAERVIPTGDYNRFEQNRRDASALQGTLWRGRDFIHDERPGLHELFTAMVEMYDAKDNPEKFEAKKKRLEEIKNHRLDPNNNYFYSGFDGELCFDLENYDKQITKTTDAWNDRQGRVKYDEKAIDILRRMAENTGASLVEKPKTDDEELNKLIEAMDPRVSERDGSVFVDFKQASRLVTRMNEILIESQDKLGIKPSMVRALSYTERMATYAMRTLDERDFKEIPFDPGFKEMVRFVDLTSSPRKYSQSGFENFYQGFMNDFSRNYNEGGKPAYDKLVMREMENAAGLAKKYRAEGKPEYMIESLWSGNLIHELIGLVDKK